MLRFRERLRLRDYKFSTLILPKSKHIPKSYNGVNRSRRSSSLYPDSVETPVQYTSVFLLVHTFKVLSSPLV